MSQKLIKRATKDKYGKDETHIFEIKDKILNGKKYKIVETSKTYWSSWGKEYVTERTWRSGYNLVIPNSPGYLDNLWKERDLDTNTKQVNLEFQKDFKLLSTQHSLNYGASYEKIKKSMTNRTG